MRRSRAIGFAVLPILIALAQNVCAQDAARNQPVALRADVRMILVPVTVMDRRGATMSGLKQNSFTLLDDKSPQKIVSFSSDDVPCSVGLVLDLSGSMEKVLQSAKDALRDFLATANPEDEFVLLGVGTKPLIYRVGTSEKGEGFTSDTGLIRNMIQAAPSGGSTALVDTIYEALGKMRSARNPRRALVIVSDGMDNHSRYSKHELIGLAAEADVQIYTIAIDAVPREEKPIQQINARNGLNYLEELADKTGGVPFVARNEEEISGIAERMGLAIRSQYLIGYQPRKFGSSGKWHRVQIKLDKERVRVYARTGYYASGRDPIR